MPDLLPPDVWGTGTIPSLDELSAEDAGRPQYQGIWERG